MKPDMPSTHLVHCSHTGIGQKMAESGQNTEAEPEGPETFSVPLSSSCDRLDSGGGGDEGASWLSGQRTGDPSLYRVDAPKFQNVAVPLVAADFRTHGIPSVAAFCRRRNNTHSARLERRVTNDDGSRKQATSGGFKQPRTAFVSGPRNHHSTPLITISMLRGSYSERSVCLCYLDR